MTTMTSVSRSSLCPPASAGHAHDEEEVIDGLLRQRAIEDNELLDDALNRERDMQNEEEGPDVLVAGATPEQLAQWSKPTVTSPDGGEVYKRTIIKFINQKVSLTKSSDRLQRVRGVSKYSTAASRTDNVIRRSYRYGFDNDSGPDSGADQLKYGDIAVAIIDARMSPTDKTKSAFMVILKLLYFGGNSGPQLEMQWSSFDDQCYVTACIMGVEECVDAGDNISQRIKDRASRDIRNVRRSQLIPISSSLEIDEEGKAEHVILKDDLDIAFGLLQAKDNPISLSTVVTPIQYSGTVQYRKSKESEPIVCNLCVPPKVSTIRVFLVCMLLLLHVLKFAAHCYHLIYFNLIFQTIVEKKVVDRVKRERILRNHMSAHIALHRQGRWEGPSLPSSPCAYCCQEGCDVNVTGTGSHKMVQPSCKTYNMQPFPVKFCKPLSRLVSSQKPVCCSECKVFVYSYNIDAHVRESHSSGSSSFIEKYGNDRPTDVEIASLVASNDTQFDSSLSNLTAAPVPAAPIPAAPVPAAPTMLASPPVDVEMGKVDDAVTDALPADGSCKDGNGGAISLPTRISSRSTKGINSKYQSQDANDANKLS